MADLSGVSIATVSRVLNSPGLVSPATAKKVQAAVQELGYRPNLFAKSLLTKRSRVIGVSLPDIHGEFYAELMHSADRRACERGYHLLVSSNAHHPEEGPGNGFALDLVDGLIVMLTERSRVDLDAIAGLRVPVAIIGVDEAGVPVETITCDNAIGARRATEHLLAGTPPERCFFVGAHRGNLDSDQRAAAFANTLRAQGHDPADRQLAFGEFAFEWGWDWAMERIAAGELTDSAILAANDEIAIGIANAARERGLDMPADLRLVGFDDSRICSLLRPELSSVRVPVPDMAREAVDALIRRLEEPDSATRHARLPTSLVIRDSSRLPVGGGL
ncbi:MAG: LacI family DNA-binding transcriptional regulator [Phycisphaeraceae bacterium]|nr:MAG: LacI family DNA-binding transcriptional regulator [Phycisphaeraceae bacterium]